MDVGTVLAAVGSSTLVATAASALVSWRVASRQNELEREKLEHERERFQHEREKYDHERQARRRDGARELCERVIEELTGMAASMTRLNDTYPLWERERENETHREKLGQVTDHMMALNGRMPGILSDLLAAPWDVLPEEAWEEMRALFLEAQQTYAHAALDAAGAKYKRDSWRLWLTTYGRANMVARRLLAEID